MRFIKLDGRPENWDHIIMGYDTKTLFHHSYWLDHVSSIHPCGRLDYYKIMDGAELIGYHCGLRIKKAGIPIHGSPLGGTGTNYMGPIINADVDQRLLIKALLKLFGFRNFLHIEMTHYWLDQNVMTGLGFSAHPSVTHLLTLPNSEDKGWAMLKGAARNRVKKAKNNGLVVEHAIDISIVRHFYEQFIEVYGKQRMVTPFDEERPRSLFEHLFEVDALLPLSIKYNDEVIATGLFPYDEKCIYFWGAASWLKYQKLCPNELLHWHVIKFAIERGIPAYNMCGGTNQFKNKFGGEDVPYVHYSKSALPFMHYARNWYKKRHYRSLKK